MKKTIAIISLFIFIILPAYVLASGSATDKTCYNTNEKITYLKDGVALWFPLGAERSYADLAVINGDQENAMFIASQTNYGTDIQVIIADTECSECSSYYNLCIASCDNEMIDYNTNDVEISYTNTCSGTAIGTMDTIVGGVINITIALITKVFSTYWPFILVFSIIAGLIGIFIKFTKLGIR